jgi:hypothetical protein
MGKFTLTLPQPDGMSTVIINGDPDGGIAIESWSPGNGTDCVYLGPTETQKLLAALKGDA